MFVYLSKKISIPNNVELRSIAWCSKDGFIACGGDEGLLKVLKLENSGKDSSSRGLAAPSNLSINQNLEGHNGSIQVIVWNEVCQKLTTSDQYGLIIVWMMYKGSWYEEMINNRNRSVVRDMAWNSEGQKICIVYEDGVVIVGSVDGNRLWGKEIKGSLVAVEWSPSGKSLLFGLSSGEVHAYDGTGNFLHKVPVVCLATPGEAQLVGIQWFYVNENSPDVSILPTLAIIYQHGSIQFMRSETDNDAVILQLDKFRIANARWSPTGTMIAISGQALDAAEGEQNMIHFYSSMGDHLRVLKVPGKNICGCSWEGSGLRIALAVDSHIFFANIRPAYKWGYCGQTIIYSFQKPERPDTCVAFWDTKLDEVHFKYVKDLLGITCFGEHCLLASSAEDSPGQYLLQLCNGIGTPVDFKYIDLEPQFVALAHSHAVAASKEVFFIWQYSVPRRSGRDFSLAMASRGKQNTVDRTKQIDDFSSGEAELSEIKRNPRLLDPVCCICANDRLLFVARESGIVQKYSLANANFLQKFQVMVRPVRMSVNCTNTRLAVINAAGVLGVYNVEETAVEPTKFDRKDVWDIKWDEDDEKLLAVMEKTRLYVFRGTDPEEPVVTSGYICTFKDLTVRTVLLDEIIANQDQPQKELIVDVEIKSLRDCKLLLERAGVQEAANFIDQNPHKKLWSLLAEFALQALDLKMTEHAFVHLKDYAGIQFVKKVNNIQSNTLRKAEIAAYFGRFDEAEKIYIDCDRRDLSINLRRKLGDWFRVLQLLQIGSGAGDDAQMEEAWNAVGDYYADRQKWRNAVNHYLPGRNQEKLAECYFTLENYDQLESLMNQLPDGHKLLPRIGEMFASMGLCKQAAEAYVKSNQVKVAMDICIQLNQWDAAVQLARSHDVPDIDILLSKYAEQLIGDPEKSLTVVQLYRKAGHFLEAAKLIYSIADEHRAKRAQCRRLKKLYVAGALLVEQFHEQNKSKATTTTGTGKDKARNVEAQAALSGLLQEDSASASDSRLIDNAWRGAEAYHFYMLTQRQLYEGNIDAAMKTSLHLTEYDDIIDPVDIYSLLALASCAARQFSVANRAFIKLESLENLSEDQQDAYGTLALEIFTRHGTKDTRTNKAECTGCETLIPDYCQVCPSCETRFPTCIVTGRPLMDYQFWLCPVCKHRAYEQEIASHKFCPLCHTDILAAGVDK